MHHYVQYLLEFTKMKVIKRRSSLGNGKVIKKIDMKLSICQNVTKKIQ